MHVVLAPPLEHFQSAGVTLRHIRVQMSLSLASRGLGFQSRQKLSITTAALLSLSTAHRLQGIGLFLQQPTGNVLKVKLETFIPVE